MRSELGCAPGTERLRYAGGWDRRDPNRIAGTVGFSVRDPKIDVFEARAVVCAAGGATNIWRPHAVGEGGVFRGRHAIGPCVDNNWLALG